MNGNDQTMYALLVGINNYASPIVPNLSGCVNDVEEMGRLLRGKFQVPTANIKVLTDSEATHDAIKKEFRDHLIAQARNWAEAGRQGTPPAFLFHYSGHGSQALDPTGIEPDGLDETIVPHDSRLPGTFDIKDWELGLLLDELNRYAENVTVVLDCCHSGSGTRAIRDSIAPTRRCEPDLRAQPGPRSDNQVKTRALTGPSGWELGGQYVLLAGCRDREEANEHIAPEGRYGALTYYLVRELSQMSPDQPLTYRELHQRVSYRVNNLYKDQMPQCEGDRDRQVFDGLRPARDLFLRIIDVGTDRVWVDGGIVHGLTQGSELRVYPEGTRSRTEADPIATLVVEDVSAARSGCRVAEGERDIPIHAPVAVHALNLGDMRRKVVLDMPDRYDLEIQLENRLVEPDVADYLEIVSPGAHADYRIQLVEDQFQVQDNSGALLVAPYALDDRDGLVQDLTHLARYKNTLALRNSADPTLDGAIKLAVKKLAFSNDDQTPIAETIAPTPGGEIIVEAGQQIVIEITNDSAVPLNVTLFDLSYDWSIGRLYPRIRGSHEKIEPGRTIRLGLSREKRDQLRPRLPEDVNEVPQIIKAIASTADIDVSVLEQPALKMPFASRAVGAEPRTALGKLLSLAMNGGATRALVYGEPEADDQWTVAQLEFRIVQPTSGSQTECTLRGGEAAVLPAYQIELEAPEGFEGRARVLTARQSTRAADGDQADLRPPAGFAGLGHLIVPVPIRPKRADVPGGAVIEIDADDLSRQEVTEDTPLKIYLPSTMFDNDDVIFALAYDGNVFYPVGRQGDLPNTLFVEWLPEVPSTAQPPLRSVRSFGHTLRLYLYKVLGQADPGTGLCRAKFVSQDELSTNPPEPGDRIHRVPSGEIRYRPLRDGELQPNQRVALFVHGFGSESAWLISGPAEHLKACGIHYDHILAFDYEHVNTTIGTNGQALANALKAAGLSSTDEITLDVFAHDMGALVCRSMIEIWDGSEFVDRCLLAGPPNEGTVLVRGKKFMPLLGTLITNLAGPNLISLVVGWALKRIGDDAKSLDDLDPDSDFLQQLNSSTSDAKVPYYIMAGRNELPPDGESFWKRLYLAAAKLSDAALDLFFNDQHDMVLSVNSMSTVRKGEYPAELIKVQVLPCHHYAYLSPAYFADQGNIDTLLEWLA